MKQTEEDSLQTAIGQLRSRGFRITEPRKLVLQMLLTNNQGLSRQQIVRFLGVRGIHLDLVSAYRTLLWLEREGFAHRLPDTNAYVACRLDDGGCHHTVVCSQCGTVAEVPCVDMDAAVQDAAQQTGFRIDAHRLEMRGTCSDCISKMN